MVSELAVLSQLTYIAYNQTPQIVADIITAGSQPFVSSYSQIQFLNANSLFNPDLKDRCCGFVIENENNIVIAIRGTENLDDYFYDLLALSNTEENSIHAGFSMYVDSFFEQVTEALNQFDFTSKNIYLTGHSLGGAAALVLFKRLQDAKYDFDATLGTQVYTFGSPPISAEKLIIGENIHHYRNEGDFVPHLTQLIGLLIRRLPIIESRINNCLPSLLNSLDQYSHNENEELWMLGYDCSILKDLAKPNLQPIRQIARSLVLRNPIKSVQELRKNNDSQNLLRKIIHSVLEKSTEEHRATLYVSRLFQNQKPPWFSSIK